MADDQVRTCGHVDSAQASNDPCVAIDVRLGQVWADNDPRSKGRSLRIVELGPMTAICEILTNADAQQEYVDGIRSMADYRPVDMRGKQVKILLRRFRPTSTGYRLVEDAPAPPSE